jgi:hypothetical protein
VLGLPLADLLPFSSAFYGAMTGLGFLIGIYGHAAKMPKLTLFGIMLVFVSTLLTMLAVSSYEGGLPPDVKGLR